MSSDGFVYQGATPAAASYLRGGPLYPPENRQGGISQWAWAQTFPFRYTDTETEYVFKPLYPNDPYGYKWRMPIGWNGDRPW